MFQIMLGQCGDDYVGGKGNTLEEATAIANTYIEKIQKDTIMTYVYILSPDGRKIDVPR